MAEIAPTGNNENELLMRCNIYFELLATEQDVENKITKDNAADKLIAAIEGTNIYTVIKNKLRDCLIKLGEIYNIRGNIQIKSLQKLMEINKDAISKLQLDEGIVPKIDECPAETGIEECKVKLNEYVEQLQKMGEKIKAEKAAKEQEKGNMEQHKEQVESINKILAELDLENKKTIEDVIKKLNQLELEGDDEKNVSNIIADLNKIKEGSSEVKQVSKLEGDLKKETEESGALGKEEAALHARALDAEAKAKKYEADMVQEIDKSESNRDQSLSDVADNRELQDAVDSVTETGKVSPTASKPDPNKLKDDWGKYLNEHKEHEEVKDEPKTYMTWLRTVGSATDPNNTTIVRSKDNLIELTKDQFPDSNPKEIYKELFPEQNVPSAPEEEKVVETPPEGGKEETGIIPTGEGVKIAEGARKEIEKKAVQDQLDSLMEEKREWAEGGRKGGSFSKDEEIDRLTKKRDAIKGGKRRKSRKSQKGGRRKKKKSKKRKTKKRR